MSQVCEHLQAVLTELGPAALKGNAAAQEHLIACGDCFEFLEALTQVNELLAAPPVHDAPAALVERVLAATAGKGAPAVAPAAPLARSAAAVAHSAPAAQTATPPSEAPGRAARGVRLVWRAFLGLLVLAWRVLRWPMALTWRLLRWPFATVRAGLGRLGLWRPVVLAPVAGAFMMVFMVGTIGLLMTSGGMRMADQAAPDRFAKLNLESSPSEAALETPAVVAPESLDPGDRRYREIQSADQLLAKAADDASRGEERELGESEGSQLVRQGHGPGGGGSGLGIGGMVDLETGLRNGAHALQGLRGEVAPLSPQEDKPAKPQKSSPPRRSFNLAANARDEAGRNVADSGVLSSLKGAGGKAAELYREGESGLMPATPEEQVAQLASPSVADVSKNEPAPVVVADPPSKAPALYSVESASPDADKDISETDGLDARAEGKEKKKEGAIRVTAPSTLVMGSLAKDEIAKQIHAALPELRQVYERAARRGAGVDGKVVVDFTIGADGRVAEARVQSSTTRNRELERGAVEVFRRLTFAQPAGGGIVKVSYPLVLRSSGDGASSEAEPEPDSPARAFLAERARTDDLTFKDATGYWANTYVPGDPALRLLAARLARGGGDDRALRLDQGARQNRQPFDPPSNAALAVYLDADQAGLDRPTRMLVQVGIKATERRSRARPAMNLAVVLDLAELPGADEAAAMRALVSALVKRRDTGDRFTLIVAGRPGGLIVPAERFAHGSILVAMQQLLGERPLPAAPTMDLVTAMETAFAQVVASDDPNTPLGSSSVLLVTAGRLGAQLGTLTAMAHDGAVNGVPMSVVGVGAGVALNELDRLTLAGQGNRRLLTAAGEADAVVERELMAQSRVVARAVRLRLRLSPGVKLVDVLGSYRLDEARAEQVRQAEQSIDRRLSRNLGLESDRGEDEEGIQIVIPAFYAGDTHTILLDVVASGAGAIADVRLRFKDLVALRNGVARANLTLPRRAPSVGPLQLNVTKNLLARRLSDALALGGELLAGGDQDGARQVIGETVELLNDLVRLVPGLAGDRDLRQDLALLDGYHRALGGTFAETERRRSLSDSLRLSSFLKILPRPAED